MSKVTTKLTGKKLVQLGSPKAKPWRRRRPARPLVREVMVPEQMPLAQIDVYERYCILTRREKSGVWRSYPVNADALALHLGEVPTSTGLLPAGTIATGACKGNPFFVLYVPPRLTRVSVVEGGECQIYEIQAPPLIWAGWDKTYRIWAIRATVLRGDLKLCRAPFSNTYPDGAICWGSAKVVAASATTMTAMLKLFLEESDFNQHLTHEKSRRYPGNIIQRYSDLEPDQPYPLDDLFENGLTLGDVVRGRPWTASW